MKKKLLSIVLVAVMMLSLLSTDVLAGIAKAAGDTVTDATVPVILPRDGVSPFTQQIPVDTGGTASFGRPTGETIKSAIVEVNASVAMVTILPTECSEMRKGKATLTIKKGETTFTRTYNVLIKPITESVQWITEGEMAEIIFCTQTKEAAAETPKVLFLDSTCTAHNLSRNTVTDTLKQIAEGAEEDTQREGEPRCDGTGERKEEGGIKNERFCITAALTIDICGKRVILLLLKMDFFTEIREIVARLRRKLLQMQRLCNRGARITGTKTERMFCEAARETEKTCLYKIILYKRYPSI